MKVLKNDSIDEQGAEVFRREALRMVDVLKNNKAVIQHLPYPDSRKQPPDLWPEDGIPSIMEYVMVIAGKVSLLNMLLRSIEVTPEMVTHILEKHKNMMEYVMLETLREMNSMDQQAPPEGDE